LLIAAVVAAIPLAGECIGIYQCKYIILGHVTALESNFANTYFSSAAGGLYGGKPQSQVFILGLDALGGYVFARMCHNLGQLKPFVFAMLLDPIRLAGFILVYTFFTNARYQQQVMTYALTTSQLPLALYMVLSPASSIQSLAVLLGPPLTKATMVIIQFGMCLGLQKGITPIGNKVYPSVLGMKRGFDGMIPIIMN
jgi:hypothetical protein